MGTEVRRLRSRLPAVNGHEVFYDYFGAMAVGAFRATPDGRLVPVVVFTSSTEDEGIRRSYDLGASSYVRKPIDYDDFAAAIGHVMDYWLGVNAAPSPVPRAAASR